MSNLSLENRPPAESASPNPPAFKRPIFLTALMIIAGLILLLPGLCTVLFGVALIGNDGLDSLADSGVWAIAIPCFLISAGGIALIVRATRRR